MRKIKLTFLAFIFLGVSLFFLLADFSFLFFEFPKEKKDFPVFFIEKSREIFTSSPLKVYREGAYFPLDFVKVIESTNREREAKGLLPLKENLMLNYSALAKNEDMCSYQYFEHISPFNQEMSHLVEKEGYQFISIGENLAMGSFRDEDDLVLAWMESPGHRENILNPVFTEIGISVLRCNFEGKNTWLIVQHFGLPLSACPEVDSVVKEKIDINNKVIDELLEEINLLSSQINTLRFRQSKEHNEKIKEYNELVSYYNLLVSETEKMINEYNSQIESFNLCIKNVKDQK